MNFEDLKNAPIEDENDFYDEEDEADRIAKYSGKWVICRVVTAKPDSADIHAGENGEEMFFFELRASNGEKLLTSEDYTTYNGALGGIETHKANIARGNFKIILSKKGDYIFKLLSGKNMLLCMGEHYATKARCESAIESTKRFARTAIIDENVQEVVERYLGQAIEDYNVKGRACAIVMNVNTGAILAMANMNQFDPNDPNTIYDSDLQAILDSESLTEETTDTLVSYLGETDRIQEIVADGLIDDDEYSEVQGMLREAQWRNKAISDLYYPGSVFKVVTAAAALDSGTLTADQQFVCTADGWTINAGSDLYEHTYHCANGTVHGWQNMAAALNNSCNIYFIQVGLALGAQTFYDYFEAFGFTQRTGVDLPSEARYMIYHDADALALTEANLDSSSFGQAQTCTPLQMATAIAAAVNGGYLVTPYVVGSITDADGNVVSTTETTIRRQVISEEVSAQIRTMMEQVVGGGVQGETSGGGRNAYVAGYRIGGKSGTGENLGRDERSDGDYHKQISFSAVLPIDDPEIEVFVMIDDPRWENDSANSIVAPVVGNIISEIAPYLGIERDPEYDTSATVRVPPIVGTNNDSWVNAQVELNKVGLSHELVGGTGTVIYMYPGTATELPVGSTVYLYTQSTTDEMTTVPNVVGKSGDFAVQMLKASGINASLEGDGSALVTAQSVAEGESVPKGTLITITTASAGSGDAAAETSGDTGGAGDDTSQVAPSDGGE